MPLRISVRPVRTPQLMRRIPSTTPATIPTVATPTARSAPVANPSSSNTGRMPAAVPCPPSKPISMRAPTIGSAANRGTRTSAASRSPTTYCPDPKATPRASCGPTSAAARFGVGSSWPRNIVANTTEMSRPGRTRQVSRIQVVNTPASLKPPPTSWPRTCGPRSRIRAPPMIELGRKSRWTHPTRTRITFPIRRNAPRTSNENPTWFADSDLPFRLVQIEASWHTIW